MRRALVWASSIALSGFAVTAAIGHPAAPVSRGDRQGFDISWPQCSGTAAHHLPSGSPSYVILGLTDGLGHTVNPCLASQVEWARSRAVLTGAYLVASYPDRGERRLASTGLYGTCTTKHCRLENDGAAQAADAVATMRSSGLNSPRIWIDVEFRHFHPWTHSNRANAAVVQGIVAGLEHAHVPMGVYSTSYMWHAIVGAYRLYVPNWLPVGHGGPKKTLRMCRTTASGGATWLAQYTRALDIDLTCPVLDPVRGEHSRMWRFRNTTQKLYSQGPAVRTIQRVLSQPVSGQYDAATALAVVNWQSTKGLEPTGQVTPIDWRALGAYRLHGGHDFWLSRIAGAS